METLVNENSKPNFLARMQQRWQVESIWQVVLILLTFTLAGSTVVYVRKWLFYIFGFDLHTSFWIKALCYLIVVFPAYQLLLLVYGTLLGQFRFFWEKEKMLVMFLISKLSNYEKADS